jgi:hypothetical protein
MSPKKQMSSVEVEALKQAKAAKLQAASMGVNVEEQVSSSAKVSYDTFIDIDNLPSKGKFYSNIVQGQGLKVTDLLLIQTIDDTNAFRVFNEIFGRRLRDVPAHELLIADELYLSLWLRANSFPGYKFPHDGFRCMHCELDVIDGNAEFDFLDMDFTCDNLDEIAEAYAGENAIERELSSGTKVSIKLKRRSAQGRVEAIIKRDFTQYGNPVPDELFQLMHLASVVSFGQSDLMETVNSLQKLSPVEFVEVLSLIKKYSLDNEPTINMACPSCEGVTPLSGYSFRSEVYLPIAD